MRPGRLDRLVYVGPPDLQGREEILRICLSKMSVGPSMNIYDIALLVGFHAVDTRSPLTPPQTEGCSGAEVVSMCQEAALLTMKDDINAPFVSCSRTTAARFVADHAGRYHNTRLSRQQKR